MLELLKRVVGIVLLAVAVLVMIRSFNRVWEPMMILTTVALLVIVGCALLGFRWSDAPDVNRMADRH